MRKNRRLAPVSWDEALALVAAKLKSTRPERIGAIAGDLAGAEEMFALKDLLRGSACATSTAGRTAPSSTRPGRASYLFNGTIEGIEQADAILLVGTNPRLEAPVLNARIRKRWRQGGLERGADRREGRSDLSVRVPGRRAADLERGDRRQAQLRQRPARRQAADGDRRRRGDGPRRRAAVLAAAARLALQAGAGQGCGWNAFNVLHTAASRVAGLDLGFVPGERGLDVGGMLTAAGRDDVEVVYLLGADEIDMQALGKAFVIYQGSHGDAGAQRADVILPGAAYTEKSATYVSTEGRAQTTAKAAFAPGDAKDDWAIVRALSAQVGHTLPYDNLPALRAAMYKAAPALARPRRRRPGRIAGRRGAGGDAGGTLGSEPFGSAVRGVLPDQSDRARVRRDGRARRAAQEPERRDHGNAWIALGPGRRSGRGRCGRCW